MYYSTTYASPVGELRIAADETNIVGLWIQGQKYDIEGFTELPPGKPELPVLLQAVAWLDRYFAGEKPEISELSLAPQGGAFRQEVWKLLCEIPYGETTTYGAMAKEVARRMNKETMSAQAVGGAVGHNPISIIIPCHRVVGSNGSLTGYAGGISKKIQLLTLEGVDMSGFFVPKKSTAP